jgi:hypothetical protein
MSTLRIMLGSVKAHSQLLLRSKYVTRHASLRKASLINMRSSVVISSASLGGCVTMERPLGQPVLSLFKRVVTMFKLS